MKSPEIFSPGAGLGGGNASFEVHPLVPTYDVDVVEGIFSACAVSSAKNRPVHSLTPGCWQLLSNFSSYS